MKGRVSWGDATEEGKMRIKRLLTGALVLGCLAVPIANAATRHRPAVTGVNFSPATFAAASSRPAAASAGGTTIRFHLAGDAVKLKVAVARRLSGRNVRGRCVKATAKLSKRAACARYKSSGAIVRDVDSNAESLRFSGRVGGRVLAPGRYRATIVAIDKRHHRSQRKRTTFAIIRSSASGGSPPASPAPPANPAPTPVSGYPNPSNTGVRAGWSPRHTTNGDLTINTPGAVLDGELVTGTLTVAARNVTIRNSWVYGSISNQSSAGTDYSGMLVEDTDVGPPSGSGGDTFPAILVAGYTLRRVHVHNMSEGPRVAAFNNSSVPAANQTIDIQDSLIQVVRGSCSHNDGIQGYGEPPRAIIIHNTIDTRAAGPDCTTGAIFVGNDNADLITIQNNMLMGGGYSLRAGGPAKPGDGDGGPGGTYDHITGNRIVNNSWGYGPVSVDDCKTVHDWSDNTVVTIDSNYQPTSTVRQLTTC
jgi:hypothetical protein